MKFDHTPKKNRNKKKCFHCRTNITYCHGNDLNSAFLAKDQRHKDLIPWSFAKNTLFRLLTLNSRLLTAELLHSYYLHLIGIIRVTSAT